MPVGLLFPLPRILRRLRRENDGIAFLEFALILPIFLSFILAGVEFANLVVANQKVQKLAVMTADLIAQSTVQPSEQEVQDIFEAVELSSQPFNLSDNGRVILTGVLGLRDGDTAEVENKLVWQRCEGSLTSYDSDIGAEDEDDPEDRPASTLPGDLELGQGQMVIVSEVYYRYEPVIGFSWLGLIDIDQTIRRTALLRQRGKAFTTITPIDGITPATC